MKIADITARTVSVGYIPPWDHDKRYYIKTDVQANVFIEITTDDGTFGWGESAHSPGIYGETALSTLGAIELLKPALIGQNPLELRKIDKDLDRMCIAGNIAARAGIDIALHDLAGKILGVPVYQLLGGRVADKIMSHQCPPATEELPEYMRKFMEEGYQVFKLKMSGNMDYDMDMVRKLVDVADGKVQLSLDANQGWTVRDALKMAAMVEKLPLWNRNVILEQPIHGEDVAGMARIARSTELDVMADDAIRTMRDLLDILQAHAADIVSLKIQRVGGFQRVQQMIHVAETFRCPYIVDEINETRLANTAVAHMALASRRPLYTGVASHTHHDTDTIAEGGLTIDHGFVSVPEAPGLGVTKLAV